MDISSEAFMTEKGSPTFLSFCERGSGNVGPVRRKRTGGRAITSQPLVDMCIAVPVESPISTSIESPFELNKVCICA